MSLPALKRAVALQIPPRRVCAKYAIADEVDREKL
jgi:hypothetical protein